MTRRRIELRDFQTPPPLARRVCALLKRVGVAPEAVLEPTCGAGSFLRAASAAFPRCPTRLGYDRDPRHVTAARDAPTAAVHQADFFETDRRDVLARLPEPTVILGDPPWVTTAALGALDGTNSPPRSNAGRLHGLDAMTGKSNFDVSGWMLVRLLESADGRNGWLAILCKTAVARKVLLESWRRRFAVRDAANHLIDARERFRVEVDACLLLMRLEPEGASRECAVFESLEATAPASTIGLWRGRMAADLPAAERSAKPFGTSPLKWRSGVIHDCSAVMELRPLGGDRFENGLGETVRLEPRSSTTGPNASSPTARTAPGTKERRSRSST